MGKPVFPWPPRPGSNIEQLKITHKDLPEAYFFIKVDRRALAWVQDGNQFTLVAGKDFGDGELSMCEMDCFKNGEPYFKLSKFSTDPEWIATNDIDSAENQDPVVAAAQLIATMV